jgi:hypothetical protein
MHSQGFTLGYSRRLPAGAAPKQARSKGILNPVRQQRKFMQLPWPNGRADPIDPARLKWNM